MPAITPPTPTAAFAPRRSTDDRILLGLCGGLAESLGTSALAIRIAVLVLSTLVAPLMLLAYTVTALVLPAEDGTTLLGEGPREQRDVLWAVVITTLAATCVLGAVGGSPLGSGWMFWVLAPFAATAAGVLWWRERGNRQPASWTAQWSGDWTGGGHSGTYAGASSSAAATVAAPVATAAPAAPETAPGVAGETFPPSDSAADSEPPTLIKAGPAADPTELQDTPPQPPTGDDGGDSGGEGSGGGEPPQGGAPHGEPQPAFEPPKAKVRRRSLALPVIAGMALIPAIATLLAVSGAIDGSADTVAVVLGLMALVATLGAVAVALLRPSYLGAVGLLLIAAFTGLLSIGTSQFGDVAGDGLGERTYQPTVAADLRQPFVLGAGELTIDLRELSLSPREQVTVDAQLGFGQLNVIVPRGVRVTTAPSSDAQAVSVGARSNGASVAGSAAAPTIELDAELRGGEVRILAGNAVRRENMELLAQRSVGFWSDEPARRP